MSTNSVKARFRIGLCAAVLVIGFACERAQAQALPGSRAAGMADAFVAVADDGSAVYWNPAGFATGPLLNVQVDLVREEVGREESATAGRGSATLVAFGVPPLGLGYYRLTSVAWRRTGTAEPEEFDRETEERSLQMLTTHHVGATVLQSIGEWLTVAATAKAVIGTAAVGVVRGPRGEDADDWLDRADALPGERDVRADVDVGAMVDAGRLRVGVTGRNLTEPEFGGDAPGESLKLRREARVGAAWGSSWPSGLSRVTVAVDADLTRRLEAGEQRRDVAGGVETWWQNRRLGLRGGARASTVGDARPVFTAGGSVGVRSGLFLDGFGAFGDEEARGWGLGLRMVF